MTLQLLKFQPGIVKDITEYAAGKNGPFWVDASLVRFRNGYPTKIGGWVKYSQNTFLGSCRAMYPWVTLDGTEYLGLGTNFYKQKNESKDNLDIWESKYLDKDNSKFFFANYENFFQSRFEENKLVGFIKNSKSWHDVSEFNQDVLRKSLNINLYID